jgi:hypothetical protein
MSNEVSICNQALSWLGANQITALNESSNEARTCQANYDELRDALLEENRWTFANATFKYGTAFSVPNDDDNWKYKHTFNLNPPIMHVLRVYSDPNSEYQTRWERKGQRLYADDDTIYLDTTIRVTNPNEFPTLFRQALAARLARDMCLGLTRNIKLHEAMSIMYENAMIDAAASDGMQGINETIPAGTLVTSRFAGGAYSRG